jgi:hypothetical protein
VTRTDQSDEALRILREAREIGYGKIEVRVSRGGTLTVIAETGEGAVKAKHEWKLR